MMSPAQQAERVTAATQMYVYGFPLVYSLEELAGFTGGHSSLPVGGPWNHVRARARAVRPRDDVCVA